MFRLAGLPVGRKNGLTWHDLRHEFVSHLVDSGGEIHEVRDAARHRDIKTTGNDLQQKRPILPKENRPDFLM